jgi:Fic family protein
MDSSRFGEAMTGQLVRVSAGGDDWAFVSQPLPRRWEIPIDLWPLLSAAKESLARLDGIGPDASGPESSSSAIAEPRGLAVVRPRGYVRIGRELLLFELALIQERLAPGDRQNDWLEVYNYGAALRRGTELLDTLPLSLRLIREMHLVLLTGVRGRDRAPGEFRRNQVHIGADRRYVPPPPNAILACLDDFERFLNDSEHMDPLIRTFMGHYQFEAIHPFVDGNGRVGRALLSLTAFKWCELSKPWLYVSPFFDRNRDDYINALFAVSTDGDWNRWLKVCLLATVDATRDSIKRCDRLVSLRDEYHRTADRSSVRMHHLIEGLFSNPIVNVTDVAKRMQVTYPTAKADLDKLVQCGILLQLSTAGRKTFYSPAIFAAAYAEED